jgi:hypothetical protein
MKIQPIQFPLNIGTATDLEIHVLEHTENETSVNVHFHLLDVNLTTVILGGTILPHRRLYANNMVLQGQDFIDYKANPETLTTLIVNMLGVTVLPPVEEPA